LGLALLAGKRVFKGLKNYLGFDAWVRKILGFAVLLGVIAIAMGLDRGVLTRISRISTDTVEQGLINVVHKGMPETSVMAAQEDLVEVVHTLRQVVCVKG